MTIKQQTFNKIGWLLIISGIISVIGFNGSQTYHGWFFAFGMTTCMLAIATSLAYVMIPIECSHPETCQWCERRSELDRTELVLNFPIGSKTICQDRGDKNMSIGEVVDHQPITRAKTMVPIIIDLKTGEKYFSLNPIPWNEALERTLRTLPWWDRYNVLYPRSKGISYQEIEKNRRVEICLCPGTSLDG